jgi:hypothetical protein
LFFRGYLTQLYVLVYFIILITSDCLYFSHLFIVELSENVSTDVAQAFASDDFAAFVAI